MAPGVYEITLNYPCSLHGNNWTLSSILHRTYNTTLESKSVGFNLSMSLSTMFNVTLELDPNVFDVKDLSPVDRRQIKVSDFLMPGPKISTKKSVWWHSFWLLIIAGLAAAVVYARRRYIRQRPAKPVTEIKLQEVARTEAEPAPVSVDPVSSAVFQFQATTTT